MTARMTGVAITMASILVLVSAERGHARCDANGADAADVATARAAVAANCDCAGATSHGQYVSCASSQSRLALTNQSCHGAVVKCAARSTCGKPGFVTCCRTTAKGVTKCSTKSSADRCKAPKGGSSCVGELASCCDACAAGSCVPPSPSGAFLDVER